LEYLLEETLKVTPIAEGTLRKSGRVRWDDKQGGKGLNSVGKIEFTDPKAVWVHECTTDYHDPPTKAKFLEDTVKSPYHQAVGRQMILQEISLAQAAHLAANRGIRYFRPVR
jgi:hypothetical protein